MATSILMHRGHHPEAIADMAWQDIERYLIVQHELGGWVG